MRANPSAAGSSPASRSEPRALLWLCLSAVFFYLLTATPPDSDIGRAVIEAGNGVSTGEFFYSKGSCAGCIEFIQRGRDGTTYYLPYEIGTDLTLGAAIGIFRMAASLAVPAGRLPSGTTDALAVTALYLLLSQLGFVLLYLLMRRSGITRTSSFLATLAAMYGCSFWFYSKPYVRDTMVVLPTLAALFWAHRLVNSRSTWSRLAFAVLAGASLAWGISIKATSGLVLPGVLAMLALSWWEHRKDAQIQAFGLPAAIIVSLCALSTLWVLNTFLAEFGALLPGWFSGTVTQANAPRLFQYAYSLLLSPGNGMFIFNPVLVLAIPGAGFLWRRDRPLAAGILTFAALNFAFYSTWSGGEGWESYGGRFMLPAAALLVVPAAAAMDRLGRPGRRMAVATVLAGALIWLPGILLPKNIWLSPAAAAVGYQRVLSDVSVGPIRVNWIIIGNAASEALLRPPLVSTVSTVDAKGRPVTIAVPKASYDLLLARVCDASRTACMAAVAALGLAGALCLSLAAYLTVHASARDTEEYAGAQAQTRLG